RVVDILAEFDVDAAADDLVFLDPLNCLARQRSLASTGPAEAARMRTELTAHVGSELATVAENRSRIVAARVATASAVAHMLGGGSLADLAL
ncbi:MAG TPA: hypothetical protein QGH10_13155, partial [Armatimonadota bacterium]|nr:hypothetical protein [Armatimonadota bacterium]